MDGSLRNITLCFDNSDRSMDASAAAMALAKAFGSRVTGVHGYNAVMHEGAFRIMEPTLPARYQKEEVLQRQRAVHKTLINVGMEKISLSYLKPLEDAFGAAEVPFRAEVREGKNFLVLRDMISEAGGDLVVMGASGFNSNGSGFMGSVCLRVLRGVDGNFLLIKKPLNLRSPRIVVGLDGSASAVGALRAAAALAGRLGGDVHLVYAFDSSLHKDLFGRLKESLINGDGFAFNSREQEQIHDEFIDKGLARVGRMILDRAEGEVFPGGGDPMAMGGWGLPGKGGFVPRVKKVLEGHVYKRICEYAEEAGADLVCLGRTGRHYAEGVDIGSVAENVARFSPASVLITRHEAHEGWRL
ncbi:MAG: hypothetical protein Kow0025_14030 [Thermodesulfovibrionales bacterium]